MLAAAERETVALSMQRGSGRPFVQDGLVRLFSDHTVNLRRCTWPFLSGAMTVWRANEFASKNNPNTTPPPPNNQPILVPLHPPSFLQLPPALPLLHCSFLAALPFTASEVSPDQTPCERLLQPARKSCLLAPHVGPSPAASLSTLSLSRVLSNGQSCVWAAELAAR